MSAAAESKPIRVAVVGAGEFGRNHARVYRELGSAELVGIYDQNRERAAAIALPIVFISLPVVIADRACVAARTP